MSKFTSRIAGDPADRSREAEAGPKADVKDDLIRNMRGRMAKCHRLADGILDDQARKALLEMASEIERDVLRLEGERDGRSVSASDLQ